MASIASNSITAPENRSSLASHSAAMPSVAPTSLGSGSTSWTGRPSACAVERPNSRSAAGFQYDSAPRSSKLITASVAACSISSTRSCCAREASSPARRRCCCTTTLTISVSDDTLSRNMNSDAVCVAGSAVALPGAVSCSVIVMSPQAITAECTNSGGNLIAAHTSSGSDRKPTTCTGTFQLRVMAQPTPLAAKLARTNSSCSRDSCITRGRSESGCAGNRSTAGRGARGARRRSGKSGIGTRRSRGLTRASIQRAHDSSAGMQMRQPKTSPIIDWIQ